jgi:hypothetical protein
LCRSQESPMKVHRVLPKGELAFSK